MHRLGFRLALLCGLGLLSLGVGLAQERPKDVEDYRRFFRKPETPVEFWKAIQFELDVGRPDLASKHVRGFLETKPDDKAMHSIIDSVGLTPILKLRAIRSWSKDAKENKQALEAAGQLIDQATTASSRRLRDPERLRELISQLKETPEEKTYALRELYKSGAYAMPELIDALGKAGDAATRLPLLEAIDKMGPAAIAPMLAALDSKNARLKVDLLDILHKRHPADAAQITPHLWYPSASREEAEVVRDKARKVLSDFEGVPEARLTPAKVALTREAERFYQKQARFGDTKGVTIWRWNGDRVVPGWPGAETITQGQANEYWGLRHARHALNLDPQYRPAQQVFLGHAIQSRPSPEVTDLVSKASVELLTDLLDRALKEQRVPEAIAVIRALGDRAEVRAKRPGGRGDAALVRALYDKDPRVSFEAAQSLLLIPGPPPAKTALRIIEVLGRELTPMSVSAPGRRVLVGIYEEDWRNKVRQAVSDAEAEAIVVSNGRDLMRQIRARADIDAILLDSTLPLPGLSHTLAELRTDVDGGLIPVLVAAIPETRTAHDLAACYRSIRGRLDIITADTRVYRTALRDIENEERDKLVSLTKEKFLNRQEQQTAEDLTREKFARLRADLDYNFLGAVRLSKDVPRLEGKLDRLAVRYDAETRVREAQLERHTARLQNVRIVHPSVFTDGPALASTLTAAIREANVALTPEERANNAEVAISYLKNLAQGKPPGYDIRPVTDQILAVLRAGKLTPTGQINAIDAAARLPGGRPQADLLAVLLDRRRPLEVRSAAADGLIIAVQKFGNQLTAAQAAPVCEEVKEAKLDPRLKARLALVIGALRPTEQKTGERLRQFDPAPTPPAPPKGKGKEKDDKGEKEKD